MSKEKKEELKKDVEKNEVKKDTTKKKTNTSKKASKPEEKKEVKKEVKEEVKKEEKEVKALKKKIKKVNTEKIVIASIVIGVLVIAFGLFGFYYYNTNAKPVAEFDGGKVTTADFTIYYQVFAPMLEYYGYPDSIIPEQIANKAGIDMIILKKAKEKGITLSDEDKQTVDEIFADEEQVQQFIDEGIDVARMKQLYYNDYTITAYIEKMQEEANDEEVLAYIKENVGEDADMYEYDTSHILFKTIDDSGNDLSDEEIAEVEKKANEALARVLAGEDFASLAKELSDDTGTKENGGQYTMYMDGNTYTEYADAVKTLEVGGVTTTLVKSQSGYHIIKLNAKTENGRAHNDTEREAFVDEKINNLSVTKNLEINTEYLTKLVEKLTGKTATSDEEESDETVTDSTTEDTTTDTTDITEEAEE